MRKIIYYVVIFVFNFNVITGQVLDKSHIQFLYKHSFTLDSLLLDRKFTDEMMLLVGDNYTSFYSYKKFVRDSLKNANPAEYASVYTTLPNGMRAMTHVSANVPFVHVIEKLYVNRITNYMTNTYALVGSMLYTEQLSKPNWQIFPDTCHVLGYTCQKATTHYKGRDWEAWFASDIAIGEGPWLLRGLPGLILKATDKNAQFTYECIGLQKSKRPIEKDEQREFRNVSKRDFFNFRKLAHEDSFAFMSVFLGENVPKPYGPQSPKQKRKYNPIEVFK